MLDTLTLMLDHIEEIMMVLWSRLTSSIPKVPLEIIPKVRFLLTACSLSNILTLIVVGWDADTLISHAVFARAYTNGSLLIVLRVDSSC